MSKKLFPQPISQQIWEQKYRLQTPKEHINDDITVKDTWNRIASACAGYDQEMHGLYSEHPEQAVRDNYYEILEDFKFLPAGRITAGAGTGRNVTLFNCYVMGLIPDSMVGIFDMLKEAALTMQQGGGIGYDFSTIRPKGANVKGVDADASGPLSFMDLWDTMCKTIMSAGSRRGAMMATMRCDHPDLMDFITAKKDPNRLRMFNMSVQVTDKFMEAVQSNDSWNLVWDGEVYDTVMAADVWEAIMESTYAQAEPGVLFVDTINKANNLNYMETITATNPCGEQPLPPYGACLLGSINLVKMVEDAFTDYSTVDTALLQRTVATAVRMLDAVIDISNFPLPEQEVEAKAKRRMGLGVTGLADMLFMLNIRYGSDEAVRTTEWIMKLIAEAAYEESIQLARELGPCPATETMEQRLGFVSSDFMQNFSSKIRDDVMQYGIRNALLLSIAPTGTISLYAGNVSSGIEPIFAPSYTRTVRNEDESRRDEFVEDYAVKLYREYREDQGWDKEPNPEFLVTAQTLTPEDHLRMQAAAQKWVDSSISKTINCPEDISYDDFKEIYMDAWKSGCKGCTTYRPNDITGSVLSITPEPTEEKAEQAVLPVVEGEPLPRPESLVGHTYKLKWQGSNAYVTINNYEDTTGRLIPFEIFINSREMEHFQWTVALTRMISAVFRRGGDVTFIVDELKNIFDPKGGSFAKGTYVPSFIALLGLTLEEHLIKIGYIQSSIKIIKPAETKEETLPVEQAPMQCSECKGFNVSLSGGCPTCGDCGYSKCG